MSKDKKIKKELKELRKKYKQLQAESNVESTRTVGDVLLDMEPLLQELGITQGLQKGDILALVNSYIDIHMPGIIEQYVEGGSPFYFYGPKEELK